MDPESFYVYGKLEGDGADALTSSLITLKPVWSTATRYDCT